MFNLGLMPPCWRVFLCSMQYNDNNCDVNVCVCGNQHSANSYCMFYLLCVLMFVCSQGSTGWAHCPRNFLYVDINVPRTNTAIILSFKCSWLIFIKPSSTVSYMWATRIQVISVSQLVWMIANYLLCEKISWKIDSKKWSAIVN